MAVACDTAVPQTHQPFDILPDRLFAARRIMPNRQEPGIDRGIRKMRTGGKGKKNRG